jgi:hypothetical protein
MPATLTWGRWTFNLTTACLETEMAPGGPTYQVNADEMKNSGVYSGLDLSNRRENVGFLSGRGGPRSAAVQIFGRGVCSAGIDHPINPKAILTTRYGIEFE